MDLRRRSAGAARAAAARQRVGGCPGRQICGTTPTRTARSGTRRVAIRRYAWPWRWCCTRSVVVVRGAWSALRSNGGGRTGTQPPAVLRLWASSPGATICQRAVIESQTAPRSVGRASKCVAIRPYRPSTARFALLVVVVVADMGSTTRHMLNHAMVDGEAALAAGDVVGLGQVRLQVVAH